VHLDDRAAGVLAARHLYALGRRRLAVLTSSPRLATQRLRLDGVQTERAAMGRQAGAVPVRASATPDLPDVAAALAELLAGRDRGRRPDALICTSGRLTLGAVHALRASGVRIPDDLAFVTFDDFPWAALNDPPLTVVNQRPHEMGVRATEVILTEPDRDDPVETVVPPTLIVRRSCGAPSEVPA
jgi:LacI family transcriptional regulator